MTEFESPAENEWEHQLRREGQGWRAARVGCPHPDLLLAPESEALDPAVRGRIAQHLAECPHCARLAGDLEQIRHDAAESETAIEDRVLLRVAAAPRKRGMHWLAIAAGMFIALGSTYLWWSRALWAPEATVARTSDPAAQPAGSGPVVPLWSVDPAEVRLPLSSLGALRGGHDAGDTTPAFVDAVAAYRRAEYDAAIRDLERVTQTDPGNGDAALYLGVSYLMTGRPDHALPVLERALERAGADRSPEIAWYLATAEQRVGRVQASRGRLAALCASVSPYQARACAAGAALK